MHREDGFTLVELSAALGVALLVVSLLLALMHYANVWFGRWQRDVMLQNSVHVMVERIAADLVYADQIEPGTVARGSPMASAWTLRYASGRRVHYVCVDSVLWRNGVPVLAGARGTKVTRFRLDVSAPGQRYAVTRGAAPGPGVRAWREMPPLHVAVILEAAGRHRTLRAATAVTVRQPARWRPLPPRRSEAASPGAHGEAGR